jgi:hypothetical protein
MNRWYKNTVLLKLSLTIILSALSVVQSNSQNLKVPYVHFVKMILYESDFNQGIPFAEVCVKNSAQDIFYDCNMTDFDGITNIYFDTGQCDVGSALISIKVLSGYLHSADYGQALIILLAEINTWETVDLSNNIHLVVTKYKKLNEKEYEKYRKKNLLMPEGSETIKTNRY